MDNRFLHKKDFLTLMKKPFRKLILYSKYPKKRWIELFSQNHLKCVLFVTKLYFAKWFGCILPYDSLFVLYILIFSSYPQSSGLCTILKQNASFRFIGSIFLVYRHFYFGRRERILCRNKRPWNCKQYRLVFGCIL